MKRIFLIGYMGAGKTTVGKVLSRQLGLSFIDLDHYIEGRYHKTVGQLFARKGKMRSEISSGGCSAKSPLLKMSWYRPEAVLLVFSIIWSL